MTDSISVTLVEPLLLKSSTYQPRVPYYVSGEVQKEVPAMSTIPAREIKRRGISAVDDGLRSGPVQVIQHDEVRYIVLNSSITS